MDTPLIPDDKSVWDLKIEILQQRYGDMTVEAILEGIEYSDEYLCNMSAVDSRVPSFSVLSSDFRNWYNMLQYGSPDPYSADACLVYTLVQQDFETTLQSANNVAKQPGSLSEVWAYKRTRTLNQLILRPIVPGEDSLRSTRKAVEQELVYWGSRPPTLSYLPAYPLLIDPNLPLKFPKPGDCCGCGLQG